MKRQYAKNAFTLIELLVVISIIALLVGILLPALGNARQSAREMKCLTQVRSFGTGLFAYQADCDTLPPLFTSRARLNGRGIGTPLWFQRLIRDGYMGVDTTSQVQRCPIVEGFWSDFITSTYGNNDIDNVYTYGMNNYLGGDRERFGTPGWTVDPFILQPLSTDDAPEASRTMLLAERFHPNTANSGTGRAYAAIGNANSTGLPHPQDAGNETFVFRGLTFEGGSGTNNFMFADGSGSALRCTQTAQNVTTYEDQDEIVFGDEMF